MEDQTNWLAKLGELETRVRNALQPCAVLIDEVRALDLNYVAEFPFKEEEEIARVWKERLHVFDCLEKGEELPDRISCRCLLQSLLLFQGMLLTTLGQIEERAKKQKPIDENMSPWAFRRWEEKTGKKLYNQAKAGVEEIENYKEVMEMLFLRLKEEHADIYNKYK